MMFQLEPAHGYAMAVALSSFPIIFWAANGVGRARKKYGIKYPQMYAEQSHPNADAFNCCQRAHQNLLESYPLSMVLLGLSSIHRPAFAALFGAIRMAGFVFYVSGYQTGKPEKRHNGAFGYIGLLGLLVLSGELSVRLIFS